MSTEPPPAVVLEAPMRRGRLALRVGMLVLLLLLLLTAPFASPTVRRNAWVRVVAPRTLRSPARAEREATESELKAIGRPTIDPAWPEMVAAQAQNAVEDGDHVFVGREIGQGRDRSCVSYAVEARPDGQKGRFSRWAGVQASKKGEPDVTVFSEPGAPLEVTRRALIVGRPIDEDNLRYHLRFIVPLDDDVGQAAVDAVKARLAKKP